MPLWNRISEDNTCLSRFTGTEEMKNYIFRLEMAVRDYECDIQGIVNNANYLHFMEHTRHQFLLSEGVSFIDLHLRGIDCVVARINVMTNS